MFSTQRPTVCVTCVWAGVDNAWEQEQLEAWKMLENAADRAKEQSAATIAQPKRMSAGQSHPSSARFVGWHFGASHQNVEQSNP